MGLQKAVTHQAEIKGDPAIKSDPGRQCSGPCKTLTASDNVEAYLAMFERVAAREGHLPDKDWADVLAPFLTADPQQAYCDLAPESAQDYKCLKAEILARLGVTVALRVNRVHGWRFDKAKPARAQLYHLMHLFQDWLKPEEKTPTQIAERVALDHFLQGLPRELRQWVV